MFAKMEPKHSIIYAQVSVLFEAAALPIYMWDEQQNIKKALELNTLFSEHQLKNQSFYQISLPNEGITLLAVLCPTKLQDIRDIAQRFKMHDFKGLRAHQAQSQLFASQNADFDIHRIFLTEQTDFRTLMMFMLKQDVGNSHLVADCVADFLQNEAEMVGIQLQTEDTVQLCTAITQKIQNLKFKCQHLLKYNQQMNVGNYQNFVQNQSMFALTAQKKPLQDKKQFDKLPKLFQQIQQLQSEPENTSDKSKSAQQIDFTSVYKNTNALTLFNLDKQQIQQLQQLIPQYLSPAINQKQKTTSFHQKMFSKSEIKKAVKYITQPQILEQILEQLIIHKNLVIVGPGHCCNLLARSLAVCLPQSLKRYIIFAEESSNASQCVDCNSIDAQLFQIRKNISQPQQEQDFTLDKLEQGGQKFEYYKFSQMVQLGKCQCGVGHHFQPLFNCAIQCVNGTMDSLDVDQLLQLGIRPQIINLTADSPEEVIQNFNFQRPEWSRLAQSIRHLKLTGACYSLHQIYQKLFFPTFKLPLEKYYSLNPHSYQMQFELSQKFFNYVSNQLISSSILSQKQQLYQVQQSFKIKELDVYFSSTSKILSTNHQTHFYDWKFLDMMNDILRLQKIYNSLYNDTQCPSYSAVQLVTMVQALQYEIGV